MTIMPNPRRVAAVLAALAALAPAACRDAETNPKQFQGYIEGEYVHAAPARAGRLEQLLVERGGTAAPGQPLFRLEAEFERQALARAEQNLKAARATLADMERGARPEELAVTEAQLKQARAEAVNAAALLARNEKLVKGGGISRQALDDARTAAKIATAKAAELENRVRAQRLPEREDRIAAQRAAMAAAETDVAQARWELDQKEVAAPASASPMLVTDTLYRVGEWVAAGSPVAQLLPPENVKLRFFVPEGLLGGIRPGAALSCRVDGLDQPVRAKVSHIAANAEYTPPVIYSNETRAKLVFMVEAKPEDAETAASLHPGQPVLVELP